MPDVRTMPRPSAAFRVGVTGTRRLDPAMISIVSVQLRDVLSLLQQEVKRLVACPEAASVYAGGQKATPLLHFVSPLAEGADQLAAQIAVDLGFHLQAPLPFARQEYRRDFAGSTATEFDRLLTHAKVLELDGARGADEARSYEAVGHVVVRNCDLLLALWDGTPSKGRGGTSDIVRYAVRSGVPVWHIAPDGMQSARLIERLAQHRRPGLAPAGPAAEAALRVYLQDTILPPATRRSHRHGLLGWLANVLMSNHALDASLQAFLLTTSPSDNTPEHFVWKSERLVLSAAAWFGRMTERFVGTHHSWPPAEPSQPDVSDVLSLTPGGLRSNAYWTALYCGPDHLATQLSVRYRSSFVIAVLGAGLALICAVLALSIERWTKGATMIEFLVLLGIVAVVVATQRQQWHERWIACRLLAELCRKQQVLALIGWSLPAAEVGRIARGEARVATHTQHNDVEAVTAWVSWYFTAAVRAAPLATGVVNSLMLETLRGQLLTHLIKDQLQYQTERFRRSSQAARGLAILGEVLFVSTVLLVGLKTFLLWSDVAHVTAHLFGIISATLAAPSAAFVGLRAYAELEMVASQSATMLRVLEEMRTRIAALPLDEALASQLLGAEMFELTAAMLQDIDGWARLFKVKAIEA